MGAFAPLRRLAQKLARPAEETLALESREVSVRLRWAYYGVAAASAALLLPLFAYRIWSWNELRISAPLPASEWRVSTSRDGLWTSPIGRARITAEERRELSRERSFWVGARISEDILARAREAQANQLLIGFIHGPFTAWIDGEQALSHDTLQAGIFPVTLPIPASRIAERRPLEIVLEIHNPLGRLRPDVLGAHIGGEGLATFREITELRMAWVHRAMARPLGLAAVFGVLALLFSYLWLTQPREEEYFFAAFFLVANAFSQLHMLWVGPARSDPALCSVLGLVAEGLRAGAALLVGLSFARVRAAVIKPALAATVGTTLVLLLALDPEGRESAATLLRGPGASAGFALGAIACLLQAAYLHRRKDNGSYLPVRIRRLVTFAGALLLAGAIGVVLAAVNTEGLGPWTLWVGFENVAVAGFLAILAAREYQQQRRLTARVPVSEYHRQIPLPDRVEGVLLVIDLKSSETLYRERARDGAGADLVAVWRSQLYLTATRHGGTVVRKKGDEVAVLFDRSRAQAPLRDALRTADEIARESALLSGELRREGSLPRDFAGFRFRGAIAPAAIRPVWETVSDRREPAWADAEGSRTFEEARELLESERNVPGDASATRLLVARSLSAGTEAESGVYSPREAA